MLSIPHGRAALRTLSMIGIPNGAAALLALVIALPAFAHVPRVHELAPARAIDEAPIHLQPITLYDGPTEFHVFTRSEKLASGARASLAENNINDISQLRPESWQVVDTMHARYYAPTTGRFLSPDPADGIQRFPQSWNRYAYARNNPLKYIDPTGLYVFAATCAANDTQCKNDQANFEQARQQDLGSRDAAVSAAAAAYGDPGVANGVTVAFGTPGQGAAGETKAFGQGHDDGSVTLTANVLIQSGLSGTQLNAVVGHEGQHVKDAQGFIATFGRDATKQYGLTWDISKNLTNRQTETNAYLITQSILASARQSFNFGCNGCTLGAAARTPADVNLAITRILTNPAGPYATKLNDRQVTGWDTPPQAANPNP